MAGSGRTVPELEDGYLDWDGTVYEVRWLSSDAVDTTRKERGQILEALSRLSVTRSGGVPLQRVASSEQVAAPETCSPRPRPMARETREGESVGQTLQ